MSTVKPIPVNLPFETVPERQGSPYIVRAAERAQLIEADARAARYDAQRQWLQLKVLPHGESGWQFRLITGPGVNQDSYVCDQGFGFKTFDAAATAGQKAQLQRARGMDLERENYIKWGRK